MLCRAPDSEAPFTVKTTLATATDLEQMDGDAPDLSSDIAHSISHAEMVAVIQAAARQWVQDLTWVLSLVNIGVQAWNEEYDAEQRAIRSAQFELLGERGHGLPTEQPEVYNFVQLRDPHPRIVPDDEDLREIAHFDDMEGRAN